MAIINYTDQLKYTGKGYLDAKMMPVKTVDDLTKIHRNQRFEGLTIVVLNDGNPQEYWLIGGTTDNCWIPKTGTNFSELKLVLEDGFLKLKNGNTELGESINLNEFFPEGGDSDRINDLYIDSVEYTNIDNNDNVGIFMCFTYSDSTKKYLDMSQFLSQTYEAGSGIIINGNIISLDSVITEKIDTLQRDIKTVKVDINSLKDRINALSPNTEGSTPDGETIGITDDERKALYVKILSKDGNLLKKDTDENGVSGLYVSIPIFCEDDEI